MRGGNRLIPLISAIGMSIFLQNAVMLSRTQGKGHPDPAARQLRVRRSSMNGVVISYMQILIFVVTFLVMFGLTLFISRSRLGRACRACAEDLKMTNLLGINSNNIIALTFVIWRRLAAVAAVLLGMQYGVINPGSASSPGSRRSPPRCSAASAASRGHASGGLLLGVAGALAPTCSATSTRTWWPSACLILVLLFRPTGILGRPRWKEYEPVPQARCSAPSS
ncbi:ABC transporter permease subunit [Pseudomonas aeruginosa]